VCEGRSGPQCGAQVATVPARRPNAGGVAQQGYCLAARVPDGYCSLIGAMAFWGNFPWRHHSETVSRVQPVHRSASQNAFWTRRASRITESLLSIPVLPKSACNVTGRSKNFPGMSTNPAQSTSPPSPGPGSERIDIWILWETILKEFHGVQQKKFTGARRTRPALL
jgi:hypothetical protein